MHTHKKKTIIYTIRKNEKAGEKIEKKEIGKQTIINKQLKEKNIQ